MACSNADQFKPSFTEEDDKYNGLGICVNDLMGNEITVKSYERTGNSSKTIILIKFWDHFGLDSEDIEKHAYGEWMGPIRVYDSAPAFRSWYILQHYTDFNGSHKPFKTVMEVELEIENGVAKKYTNCN
ncbi:hypothetical protein AGMMS50284_5890 [Clostridia bacterium]|nr:hypothetical protein AGMMS50284_5890 [Clostridia bacterium]